MSPRKVEQMMRQMGIKQVDIPALEVIIKGEDKDLIITNPSVSKVNMMGQETFQISGDVQERERPSVVQISAEDVKTVMEQAHVGEGKAKVALEEHNGDLAEAILALKSEE